MRTLGLNLRMRAQTEWLGVGGMRWHSISPLFLNWVFSKRSPPDVVLIYCGGNDLGKRKCRDLVTAMKDDMEYLHWRFPKLRIVYSAITQRRRWGTRQRAFPPRGLDRARKWVNSKMAYFMPTVNGVFVHHHHIRWYKKELYCDEVHLSDRGHDILINNFVGEGLIPVGVKRE